MTWRVFVIELSSQYGRRTTPETISPFIKPIQFDSEDLGQPVLPFSIRFITFLMKTEVREEKRVYLLQPFCPIYCLKI